MASIGYIAILFAVGIGMLLLEIFIPSQGVLTIAGLGFLVAAIVKTFQTGGNQAGFISIVACMIFLPTFAYFSIKYWPLTPIGRRIAPPNPTLTVEDTTVPILELQSHIGQTGKCTSPLRPVGICDFQGKRISCIAEFGMIDSGTEVEGVSIKGANLAVREKKSS